MMAELHQHGAASVVDDVVVVVVVVRAPEPEAIGRQLSCRRPPPINQLHLEMRPLGSGAE